VNETNDLNGIPIPPRLARRLLWVLLEPQEHEPRELPMASIKMLSVAAALTLAWMGVAAFCFSSIAGVRANLAAISHQGQKAPASAPTAPGAAVASAARAPASAATP
jgi:hypothetical protein